MCAVGMCMFDSVCVWVCVCVCVCRSCLFTCIMCPVEMSMLDGAVSSLQDEVLLRAEGLGMGPSLNCDDTLLMREVCAVCARGSGRSPRSARSDVCNAMRWRLT